MATADDAKKIAKEILEEQAKAHRKLNESMDKTSDAFEKLVKKWAAEERKMEDVIDSLVKQQSKYLKSYLSASDAMQKAAENVNISNADLDKQTKKAIAKLKKTIEDSSLSDEVKEASRLALDNIKSYKKLGEAMDAAADSIQHYTKLQDDIGESEQEIKRNLEKLGMSADKASTIIKKHADQIKAELKQKFWEKNERFIQTKEEENELQEQINKELSKNILNEAEVTDLLKQKIGVYQEFLKTAEETTNELERLNKTALAPFRKYLSDSTEKLKNQAKELITVAYGTKKFIEGLKQGYQEFVKLNSVGLAGTFWNLQATAIQYQISMESLIKISDKNRILMYRDAINNSKTFNEAQSDFLDQTQKIADEGLTTRLGKEEGFLAAAGIQGVARKAGMNKNDAAFVAPKLAKNFLQLNGLVGTTSEEYTSGLESLQTLEATQQQLISANEEQRRTIMLNNAEQFRQGKLLGLSNAQIEQQNQQRADALNPMKTDLKQRLMNDIVGPKLAGMLGSLISPEAGAAAEKAQSENVQFANRLQAGETLNETEIEQQNKNSILLKQLEAERQKRGVKNLGLYGVTNALGNAAGGAYQSSINAYSSQGGPAAFNTATDRGILAEQAKNMGTAAANATKSVLQPVQEGIQTAVGFLNTALGQLIVGAGSLLGAGIMHMKAAANLILAAKALQASAGGKLLPDGSIDKTSKKGGPKGGGKIGTGLQALGIASTLFGGYEAWNEVSNAQEKKNKGEISEKEFNRQGGGAVGALAGAGAGGIAGAQFGATVGAAFGGVGALPGALIGGTLGSVVGGTLGYFGGNALGGLMPVNEKTVGSAASALDKQPVTQATTSFGQSNPISKIIANEPGKLTVQRPDGSVEVLSGSRNWRNNNPGNIEAGDFANKNGAIGSDGRFAIFPTYEVGDAARATLLKTGKSYSGKKLTDQISTYAPPSENNTAAYQATVLAAVNGKNVPFADYTPEEQTKILDAMKMHEGFKPGKIATITPGTGINTPIQTASITPSVVAKTTVSQPSTPSAASINTNADMLIAKNIETSNKHLANISRGIEQLILSSNSGRVGTPLQKIPQNSTEAYKPG